MKNNLFYRILLSYTPIFFVVISTLIVIFYIKINTESQNQIKQTNEVLAGHISRTMDSSLKLTEYVILNQLLTDEKIKMFYNAKVEITPFLAYEISKKLNDISSMFPYLNDVYVYNKTTSEIITKNTVYMKDQFLDKAFIEKIQREPLSYRWTAPRPYKEFQDTNTTDVVTLSQKVPLSLTDQGILVANVRVSNIKNMIEESTDATMNNVLLLDADNKPFFSQKPVSLSESSLFKEKSAYTGWTTVTGLKDSTSLHALFLFSDAWTIVGILTIMIGIAWLTYVTHRNYKPIQSIINKIDSFSLQMNKKIGGSKPEEFNFILTALDKLIEQSNDYEKQHKDDLVHRRKLFFRDLVDGTRAVSAEYWKAEMERLDLPYDYMSMAVVIVELDKYKDFTTNYSYRDQQLFKYVLSNVIGEISADSPVYIWNEWREANQLCCICLMQETGNSGKNTRLIEIYDALRVWVEHNLQFTISVGLGEEVHNAADIALSYEKAHEALNYKSSLGSNRIIGHWEVGLSLRGDIYPFMQMTQALVQQFKMGDDWKPLLTGLFGRLKELVISNEETQNILNYMVFHFHKELQKIEEASTEFQMADIVSEMSRVIEQIDTLEEIEIQLTLLLDRLHTALIRWQEEHSNHALIVRIKDYINVNYTSSELSLQHLSDKFGLSPRYVSKLFKDAYGEKFVDYVTSIRMDKAKEHLIQSTESVQEIAERVGYTTDISFIRTFKRIVGQTPGEFRKSSGLS